MKKRGVGSQKFIYIGHNVVISSETLKCICTTIYKPDIPLDLVCSSEESFGWMTVYKTCAFTTKESSCHVHMFLQVGDLLILMTLVKWLGM